MGRLKGEGLFFSSDWPMDFEGCYRQEKQEEEEKEEEKYKIK